MYIILWQNQERKLFVEEKIKIKIKEEKIVRNK